MKPKKNRMISMKLLQPKFFSQAAELNIEDSENRPPPKTLPDAKKSLLETRKQTVI